MKVEYGQIYRTVRWHIDAQTRLFPFDGLPILKWMGIETPAPHEHQTKKRWTTEGIMGHPLWNAAIGQYDGDWEIWQFAIEHPGEIMLMYAG